MTYLKISITYLCLYAIICKHIYIYFYMNIDLFILILKDFYIARFLSTVSLLLQNSMPKCQILKMLISHYIINIKLK